MSVTQYDTKTLTRRAEAWRHQANTATLETLREFCLAQAEECERRLHQSKTTPVLRDRARLIGTT